MHQDCLLGKQLYQEFQAIHLFYFISFYFILFFYILCTWSGELGISFVDCTPLKPPASSCNLQNIYFLFNPCVNNLRIFCLTDTFVE